MYVRERLMGQMVSALQQPHVVSLTLSIDEGDCRARRLSE